MREGEREENARRRFEVLEHAQVRKSSMDKEEKEMVERSSSRCSARREESCLDPATSLRSSFVDV